MTDFPKIIVRSSTAPAFAGAVPPLLQRLYAARGALCDSDIETGLETLPKPEMKGLAAACTMLADAIEDQKRILIVGDFDCDGATSTSVAMLGLRALGAGHVDYLVPNRFEYGYGLTPEIVEVAAERQPDLIVTVDNGISSIDGVAAAHKLGIPVLVTDHHLPGDNLPDAAAIVNPNQYGCPFPAKSLAGVGVMFYVLLALRSELRSRKWFSECRAEPNLAELLDLVALGTVADVVPLEHANRVLVSQGLRRIRAGRCRPGITALLRVAGKEANRIVAADMGFAIGPRLNAAGRLDDISLGIRCLLTENDELALNLAAELDDLNKERRAIEQSMKDDAVRALAHLQLDASNIPSGICLYDPTWHQGVVGILASRIKERYHRPVIAFADADDEEIKGSARSIPGLHLRDALDLLAKRNPGLLSKFGGHAMAAGLSLAKADYSRFEKAFDNIVTELTTQDQLTAVVLSDGELQPEHFSIELAELLRNAGPWGQNFPEPKFHGRFNLVQQRIVGARHLKMVLSPVDASQQVIDAIAFNIDTELWPNLHVKWVDVVYKLDSNLFRERLSVQLLVDHVQAVADSS
ncbi:Single-stranded-DNA-specific exonuclease RecJ [Zhongshania aliphaticivorans]|uniref:Single-stranded-DNA-specific exonuclease RecJ n=1 Tax=Zhongshania aliphaticivorans TaxID=1470434 RepID=A0A5S9NIG9_9GAMM|nr:single-stranded-DNA-specific exonuclease RecJ [Zhongshania aliphaticivorans]CAA0090069.1 Single-stranded-DNA-specific exonuclease RecJ [Zhongshania aliphaticivorans]CAA0097337.1 Single-stranded-DNA-specific exonuclease RecJ [Zhongshania aliphaticivorans]